MAVWENLASLRDAIMRGEFQKTLTLYPDQSNAHPIVVRTLAVPGVCAA